MEKQINNIDDWCKWMTELNLNNRIYKSCKICFGAPIAHSQYHFNRFEGNEIYLFVQKTKDINLMRHYTDGIILSV